MKDFLEYDGDNWLMTNGGKFSLFAFKRVEELLDILERDFGLHVTDENPIVFDLSRPMWGLKKE